MKIKSDDIKNNQYAGQKAITLITLVITIIILMVLVGATIVQLTLHNILTKSSDATEENQKQLATEIVNLKITNVQIIKYAQKQRMPTLKEVADNFCEDSDFEYVLESSKISSLTKISNENPTSIYTKLKAYPYEFEINSSLQLASIDGIKIANVNKDNEITITKEEYEQLKGYKQEKENLEIELNNLQEEKKTLEQYINQLENKGKNWTLVVSFNTHLGWNGNYSYGSATGTITVKSIDGNITITQSGGTKTSPTEKWSGNYYINARTTDFRIVSFTMD